MENRTVNQVSNSTHYLLPNDKLNHFMALEELNKIFYEHYATAFHSTREYGWRGWKALLTLLDQEKPLSVADIACGNGRLADFLQRVWQDQEQKEVLTYIGLERSTGLLNQAKKRPLQFPTTWLEFDWCEHILEQNIDVTWLPHKVNWVTLFGVFHHVYSIEMRIALIQFAVQFLQVNGTLSISLWNFGAQSRYQKKYLSWPKLMKQNPMLSPHCIEEGDYLLGWAGEVDVPRFCHWQSKEEEKRWFDEIARLIPELSEPILTEVEGDQNRYWSWRLTRPLDPT